MTFDLYNELQIGNLSANANNQSLCFRITEASKGFQMEKIEDGYENMNQFTVNLSREEKIIREIDFDRGKSIISPKLLSYIAIVCNLHDDTEQENLSQIFLSIPRLIRPFCFNYNQNQISSVKNRITCQHP